MFDASRVLDWAYRNEPIDTFWQAIIDNHFIDEAAYLDSLITLATPVGDELGLIENKATHLIRDVRNQDAAVHMVDALLQEYSLDTEEGVLLMCLAEALLRIPDAHTADALIRDKVADADWERHLGRSESVLVNASTWGMLLTGKVVRLENTGEGHPRSIWKRLVNRCGEPVIRKAMYRAMAIMGRQFVLGRDIGEALDNAREYQAQGYSYSFDMLGEAALTESDAKSYFDRYWQAIDAVGMEGAVGSETPPSISIKLSALHSRYQRSQMARVNDELVPRLRHLVRHARKRQVPVTIDAEEMDRLELSLEVFASVYASEEGRGWGGFGLAVQAYSKMALPVLCWLNALARNQGDVIPVRLVKGAYWDTEIKHCQQLGVRGYPVFTRKESTDVSYLACARYLLSGAVQDNLYPQFASHNAHTVAAVLTFAEQQRNAAFEFQRLHGMGDALYGAVRKTGKVPVRIYAPVGAHKELLPYLVRRLLENGANSSFVHRLVDAETPIADLVQHPVKALARYSSYPNSRIPLPKDIFQPQRINSHGVNLAVLSDLEPLMEAIRGWEGHYWVAAPIINGQVRKEGEPGVISNPANQDQSTGQVYWSRPEQVSEALAVAEAACRAWQSTPVEERAQCLERYGALLEANHAELVALCSREAGKTLQDGIDEIREAVDFSRYYAVQAREQFASSRTLPGPTGEANGLYQVGRGVFVCISPWNFPLAIFSGQIMAALAAGNSVLAKPAEQSSLIAFRAVELMLQAGFPPGVIHYLPGDGASLGKQLLSDARIAGVAFTGSTETAHLINRTLAAREGAIVPLIAETGGQNAMIVDSSALPEQVVRDVVQSAFTSAGQRCSALRVLYVQEDVADTIENMLAGAMAELRVGDPAELDTDVGPVIDDEARRLLKAHIVQLRSDCRGIGETVLPTHLSPGFFVAPVAFGIEGMDVLDKEHFGPVLHVVRYKAAELDGVIDEINRAGYGLTLGIHSRSNAMAAYIEQRVKVGNTYINRNQIGAVVGVQPFGGCGLSGTGPKAGGPHYLQRFATERTRTINTAAIGGNASLLSLGVEELSLDDREKPPRT